MIGTQKYWLRLLETGECGKGEGVGDLGPLLAVKVTVNVSMRRPAYSCKVGEGELLHYQVKIGKAGGGWGDLGLVVSDEGDGVSQHGAPHALPGGPHGLGQLSEDAERASHQVLVGVCEACLHVILQNLYYCQL